MGFNNIATTSAHMSLVLALTLHIDRQCAVALNATEWQAAQLKNLSVDKDV